MRHPMAYWLPQDTLCWAHKGCRCCDGGFLFVWEDGRLQVEDADEIRIHDLHMLSNLLGDLEDAHGISRLAARLRVWGQAFAMPALMSHRTARRLNKNALYWGNRKTTRGGGILFSWDNLGPHVRELDSAEIEALSTQASTPGESRPTANPGMERPDED
jgi:hypothetical protein